MLKLFFSLHLLLIINCGYTSAQSSRTKLNWSNPVLFGYKSNFFEKLGQEASDSIPSLGSLLVWRKNGLVCQQYFNGATDSTGFDVKSVTKSVVSALVGIARDKGLMSGLNTPVLNILTEYSAAISMGDDRWYSDYLIKKDSVRRTLTLRHLLTMQTGFLWNDNSPMSSRVFISSSDPVRFVLDLPFENSPGTTFNYCTGGSHVMSAVLCKCIKGDMWQFADSMLFRPAGMLVSSWPVDPLGRPSGGSAMVMDAQSMMKFGLLFLHSGKVDGRQIISESWINESTKAQVELNEWDVLPGADGYGYFWWRRITNGHQAFIASGYGGQLICIIPDLEMVIVTTCFVNNDNRGRSEIRRLHGFIDKIVEASK